MNGSVIAQKKEGFMFNSQDQVSQHGTEKRDAKDRAIGWTIIYSLLFLPSVQFALLSTLVFDGSISLSKGLLIIFLISLIPIGLVA